MATISVDLPIAAPRDRVWKIISDLDAEPKFWKGTKSIRNISEDGDVIRREITIAFRDQKCMQEVRLFPEERIEFMFTGGIIDGQKVVSLRPHDDGSSTVLSTVWDIKMTGMMGLFTGMLKGHIRNGTDMAMKSIKEAAERGGE